MEDKKSVIDESVKVEMTRDAMLGIISFKAAENGGRLLTYTEVMQAIVQAGIVAGIKKEVVEEIVQDKIYEHKYIIAQGEPAQNGKDAIINIHFDVEQFGKLSPKENGDGTVDFKDLDSVRNVTKGEVLADKIPATEGIEGRNILGRTLKPKKGKDYRLPMGKNTLISEDGLKLIAGEDGKLEYDGSLIAVSTVCLIDSDIDNSTGNIDFVGSVIISGSVHDGFEVRAKGSIEVRGAVEGATLIAGGDIILSYGIQGNSASRLKAGGNIIAKFIQNATAEAEGDIVAEGIWNSTVNAGGVVKVDIGKGSIMGGNIMATNIVMARNVGSPMGVITGIQTGIKPEVIARHKELEKAVKQEEEELANIEKEIIFMKTRYTGTDQIKRVRLQKLMYARQTMLEQLNDDRKQYEKLTKRIENATEGIVKVSGKIYPGTKMMFGNIVKEITSEKKRCTFRKVGQEVYMGDYNEQFIATGHYIDEETVKVVEDGLYVKEMGAMRYRKK